MGAAAQKKLPDDVEFEEWIKAIEGWNSHLNKVNELAYTSSFGEYNPGGGKEQVKKYLDLAQAEVVLSRDSLAAMIKLLGIWGSSEGPARAAPSPPGQGT